MAVSKSKKKIAILTPSNSGLMLRFLYFLTARKKHKKSAKIKKEVKKFIAIGGITGGFSGEWVL